MDARARRCVPLCVCVLCVCVVCVCVRCGARQWALQLFCETVLPCRISPRPWPPGLSLWTPMVTAAGGSGMDQAGPESERATAVRRSIYWSEEHHSRSSRALAYEPLAPSATHSNSCLR